MSFQIQNGELKKYINDDGAVDVVIPENVTVIQSAAFEYCNRLRSVTIPSSVTYIGDGAFFWCTRLKSVTIPDSVTEIGNNAFFGTPFLKTASQNGMVIFGRVLYSYFGDEIDVSIPLGIAVIGSGAFGNCRRLKTVILY